MDAFRRAALLALVLSGSSVARAQTPSDAALSSAARSDAAPTAPGITGPTFVNVEADPGVKLRRHGGRFGFDVCAAPCDVTVEVSSEQRFFLEGLPYDAVMLELTPLHRNDIVLEGDAGLHVLGFVSFALGATALGAGGLTFAFHGFIGAVYDDPLPTENVIAYSSMLAGGAALLAFGLPLWLAFEPGAVVHAGEALRVSVEPNGMAVRF